MPKPSSPAPSVPPFLAPDSAAVWARLRNYVRRTDRRILLVIRQDSPRLPRELPPLLAEESGRPLVAASVSDAEPDPMAAAVRAAPGGRFPAGCILSITGAEDLAITAPDGSRAALYEFARRLDLRRDQFLPDGGIVLVWATARVFDALAEHALNFISRAAAVLTLGAAGEKGAVAATGMSSVSFESIRRRYHLPPLPPDAPADLRAALNAFEELAVAGELYHQGGPKIAHALARFDAARDNIEAGWATAQRWGELPPKGGSDDSSGDPICDFARALLTSYPSAGASLLSLRQHPREHIAWLETQLAASRVTGDQMIEGHVLGNLGIEYKNLGDMRKAIGFHEQDLILARKIGDRRGEGGALGNLGLIHEVLGDAMQAIGFYEQHLAIARETRDRQGEGNALGNLGNAYAALGDTRKAIELHEQARGVFREIGDRLAEGKTLGNLGIAYSDLGDARKAIELYEQHIAIAREIGDRRGEGSALGNSASEFWKLGNRREAFTRADAALRLFDAIESPDAAKARAVLAEWRKAKTTE